MATSHPTHQQILQLLKAREGGSVSGTYLASTLGLTRTAVWKQIQHLKTLGYAIESHPKAGYRLTAVPDRLIAEEIVSELRTSWLGRTYHYFPEIGSTNDHALQLAAQAAPHGTVVVAETQTQGRGRLRRPWVSPPGCGIYLSLILRTPLPLREASHATLVAALALVEVLRREYRLPAAIKWPNDVLIEGKKIAGILTELQSDQDITRFLVIGIGINVNHQPQDLAGPFRYPATSIAAELGRPVRRQDLLLRFLYRFESLYERLLHEGFAGFLAEVEQTSAIVGKHITVITGRKELSGKALGFTPEGALKLLTPDGNETDVWVGDVTRVEGTF